MSTYGTMSAQEYMRRHGQLTEDQQIELFIKIENIARVTSCPREHSRRITEAGEAYLRACSRKGFN